MFIKIRVSKGLLRNLYWQIAQKKYGKFLFVQSASINLNVDLLTPEAY